MMVSAPCFTRVYYAGQRKNERKESRRIHTYIHTYTICVKKTGLVKLHENMRQPKEYFIYIY